MASKHHIPALDGLRGIAVLLVMWVHIPAGLLGSGDQAARLHVQPGYLGVDIFFVLSGFLITRILLVDREKGYPLRNFLMRRFLRIFPIYYLTLALMCIVAYGPEMGWCAAYLPNFYFPFQKLDSLLQHTWSLAVEEHFYLVWPLLVYLLSYKKSRALIFCSIPFAVMCAVFATLAPDLSGTGTWLQSLKEQGVIDIYDPEKFIYQATPFRVSSLAIGCLFAFCEAWIHRRPRRAILIAFLCLVLAEGFLTLVVMGLERGYALFPLKWAPLARLMIFNVVSGSIVLGAIAMCSAKWRVIHVIQNPALSAVGRISYGLYLYHYPVYHWVGMYSNKDGGATLWTVLFGIALTLVVATLSFLFIEKPLLRFAGRFRKKEPTE